MSKTTIPTGGITADAINATLVTDDAISDEHLDVTAVTGQTAITSLADTDKFLVSDASDSGNLKYVEKQYLGGGALIKTGQTTLGSDASTLTVDNCFTSDYGNYFVVMEDMTCTSDDQNFRMRFRTGGASGSTDTGSQYRNASRYFDDDGSTASNTGVDQQQFTLSDGSEESADWKGFNGFFVFYQPQENSSSRFSGSGSFTRNTASDEDVVSSHNAGHYDSNAIHTGLHFFYSSGNLRAGANVIVYGISEA